MKSQKTGEDDWDHGFIVNVNLRKEANEFCFEKLGESYGSGDNGEYDGELWQCVYSKNFVIFNFDELVGEEFLFEFKMKFL